MLDLQGIAATVDRITTPNQLLDQQSPERFAKTLISVQKLHVRQGFAYGDRRDALVPCQLASPLQLFCPV